ncbi:MAG: hypothetical protein KC635_12595 [Myxococcales bacterium]|nr:hypothetical protein [Myxococcales bacterium]MCB9736753.1 hypothetical protein [Deltaproteobacteria bacterium]
MTDAAPAWLVAARRAVLAAAVALLAVPACSPSVSDLASFIGSPYGDLSENVTDLEGDDLDAVMTELMLRFRTYLALRTIIPFSELAPEQCMSNVESGSSRFAFTADVNCTFGDAFAPAEGQIDIAQEQVADNPVVIELDVDYKGVIVGELTVDGSEHIEETTSSDGASIRKIRLTQDGIDLDYEFRLGFLDEDVPVFDYELPSRGGNVLARVSNPQTVGAFVSVVLTGLDGALVCEVRDAAWEPGDAARGTCCPVTDLAEDGTCPTRVTFGLPRTELGQSAP